MPHKLTYNTALLFIILMVTGCASAPPYQPPANAPLAFVSNYIPAPHSRNNNISIDVYPDNAKLGSTLYYMSNIQTTPEGKVAVEANKPLKFSYHESMPDRYCRIEVEATLKPNQNYGFIGGVTFEKSIIPFLPNRGCEFAIREAGTGKIVSHQLKK